MRTTTDSGRPTPECRSFKYDTSICLYLSLWPISVTDIRMSISRSHITSRSSHKYNAMLLMSYVAACAPEPSHKSPRGDYGGICMAILRTQSWDVAHICRLGDQKGEKSRA